MTKPEGLHILLLQIVILHCHQKELKGKGEFKMHVLYVLRLAKRHVLPLGTSNSEKILKCSSCELLHKMNAKKKQAKTINPLSRI